MQSKMRRSLEAALVAMLSCTTNAVAADVDTGPVPPATPPTVAAGDTELEEIFVTARRDNRETRGAMILPSSLMDTPQSVTIVDAELMQDFGLDDVNRLLGFVTGVNVEAVETDRTYYNSRGFDIKSMQVDNVGMPFNWNVVGTLDTYLYDKIEVIRGANGLLTGTGNPSGTVNYIRKRPTNDFQAAMRVANGSWDTWRVEGDLSGPLTESASWAGRLVGAVEDGDSYLDHYSNRRDVLYGVVEGQLGDSGAITLGYTMQNSDSDGVLWGALPMLYSNGRQTNFPVSTSTTMDWTFWNNSSETAFVEGLWRLPKDWQLQATVTWNSYDEESELFYTYAYPGLDETTGLGLYGYPGKYSAASDRTLLDATVSGPFELGGRSHELVVGVNWSQSDEGYWSNPAPGDDPAWGALPSFPGWNGREIPRPAFGARQRDSDWSADMQRLYAVARLRPNDAFDVVIGVNAVDVSSDGYSFGESMDYDEQDVSPYVGLVYRLLPTLNAYASWSDIFEPQSEVNEQLKPLGAATGTSYEGGLRTELLEKRLLASIAVFYARQDNYAEYADVDLDSGISYYTGTDVTSQGVELEVSGSITERWQVTAGYTDLSLKDQHGAAARTFIPRQTFNLTTRYAPALLPGLHVGAAAKWQSDIYLDTAGGKIRQDARAVWSAFLGYEIGRHWEVTVMGENLSDEKYLASLYWDQAFYAPPRNWTASVGLNF